MFKFYNFLLNHLIYFGLIASMMNCARASEIKNLTSITWSHGTNSQELLTEALVSEVNFIEADIVYGFLENDTSEIRQPIMAHPPLETSDITLEEFMRKIKQEKSTKEKLKGVKLDFKSIEAFTKSLEILNAMWTSDFEIWLNADIYSGPLNATNLPVDADEFLNEAKKFPTATLSIGWTTKWGSNFTDGSYTRDQVDSMINGIRSNQVTNPLTFPLRAGIAANSIGELEYLYESLKDSNDVTFTIWSSATDLVDVEGLRKMIFKFGIEKVYIDVPDILYNQLDLSNDPYSNHGNTLLSKITIAQVALAVSTLMMFFS